MKRERRAEGEVFCGKYYVCSRWVQYCDIGLKHNSNSQAGKSQFNPDVDASEGSETKIVSW